MLIVGDLNHHLERDAYENLLEVQGLTDHVTFPTHERGGTLDPVISDYQEDGLQCHQLELVGSSDHHAVLTQMDVNVAVTRPQHAPSGCGIKQTGPHCDAT